MFWSKSSFWKFPPAPLALWKPRFNFEIPIDADEQMNLELLITIHFKFRSWRHVWVYNILLEFMRFQLFTVKLGSSVFGSYWDILKCCHWAFDVYSFLNELDIDRLFGVAFENPSYVVAFDVHSSDWFWTLDGLHIEQANF